ncbi:MAG: hypothetical protein BAA04_04820 [Firmicutes bacterium ZCTH02-B6]|nr:MAG: hypothetical protein BAA04_04820 [Firmicutes bacterium ZCTH02-B6]
MRVKLTGYVRHNGARYAPGSILSLPERDGQRLVRLHVAVELPEAPMPLTPQQQSAESSPKSPDPPAPPAAKEGPEFVAALTPDEVADALEYVQDPDFVRRVIEIEQAKPEPRAEVIEVAQRRLAALAGGE